MGREKEKDIDTFSYARESACAGDVCMFGLTNELRSMKSEK